MGVPPEKYCVLPDSTSTQHFSESVVYQFVREEHDTLLGTSAAVAERWSALGAHDSRSSSSTSLDRALAARARHV